MPDTASEIITNTLQFLPHRIPFPRTTVNDHLKHTVDNIVTLLSTKWLTATPNKLQQKHLQVRDAFRQVAIALNNNTPIHSQPLKSMAYHLQGSCAQRRIFSRTCYKTTTTSNQRVFTTSTGYSIDLNEGICRPTLVC